MKIALVLALLLVFAGRASAENSEGKALELFRKEDYREALLTWFAAEQPGAACGPRLSLRGALLAALEARPADPVLLRLCEPDALGSPWVSFRSNCNPLVREVEAAAGSWALQPRSEEAARRLDFWLDLWQAHPIELKRPFRIPGVVPVTGEVEKALLWMAAARLEHLAGRPLVARACSSASRTIQAPVPELDVFQDKPYVPLRNLARTKLAAHDLAGALAAFRHVSSSVNAARDGWSDVTGLIAEARKAFPDDFELRRLELSLRWTWGRAMPKRSRLWALAALEALKRGERTEAVRRLAAARHLVEALTGPEDPCPELWGTELWLRRDGKVPHEEPGIPIVATPPPGRFLPTLQPPAAFRIALEQRRAARARAAADPRWILERAASDGKAGPGLLAEAEHLLAAGQVLGAGELLATAPSATDDRSGAAFAEKTRDLAGRVRDALVALDGGRGPSVDPVVARRRVALLVNSREWASALAVLNQPHMAEILGTETDYPFPVPKDADAIDLLNCHKFSELRAFVLHNLHEKVAPPDPARDRAAEGEAGEDVLAGLRRDLTPQRTHDRSPFGGFLPRPLRVGLRFLVLMVIGVAWVRLHLFLIASFVPGLPFARCSSASWRRRSTHG